MADTNANEDREKSRNTNYCCVPQCHNYLGEGVRRHYFPKDVGLKKTWEAALKMGKPASSGMKVCGAHFLPENYFPSGKTRHKLFPHVVPSQNLPKRKHDRTVSPGEQAASSARAKRAKSRQGSHSSLTSAARAASATVEDNLDLEPSGSTEAAESGIVQPSRLSVSVQVNLADHRRTRPSNGSSIADILCENSGPSLEKCTQVNFLPEVALEPPSRSFKFPELLISHGNLYTFTGIHSVDLLDAIVSCVEEIAIDAPTNKKILSVRDRVLVTMVKIKEDMTFSALGILFGVSAQTCANYFTNMCPLLATVLKVVIPFPDQELIRCNLPKSFHHYRHTRIVLDCAETPLEKCKCLKCRVLTYSQYKKDHTVKFNLGITPSGLITELSAPYGGRASDKTIVNDSGILDRLDYGDGVMVDKGYRIEKECDQRNLDLIRPPFLKKKQQMSREDALKNAEIARARVHVERVIQRMRQYEFLHGRIPWPLTPYIDDVLTIIAGLTNLGPPIMNIDKFM